MAFLQDEDDVRVFEAALSFVDEYSVETKESPTLPATGTPSFTVDCFEASTMVPFETIECPRINAKSAGFQLGALDGRRKKPKPKPKPKPNRARDEAQYELVYLRDKVAELETTLRSLQLNASETEQTAVAVPVPINSLARSPRVWEEMATHQRRRRDLTQLENARLKVLVERKHKMVASLSDILRRRLHQQNTECLRVTGRDAPEQKPIQVLDFHGDIRDFQDLFRRLEAAFQEQDAVFTANGLSDVLHISPDVQVREVDDMHVDIFAIKMLPFSLHDAGEAAWDHFKGIEKHLGNGGLYGKSMKNLDEPFTIVEDFTKELFSKNLRADVQVKQVIRRCVKPDRHMILFVSSINPAEIKHKAVNGLLYHALEYAITKRAPDSTPELELSVLQLCSHISIECKPGVSFDAQYIRSIARFWVDNMADNIRCYQERIENALVDQALRSQSH